MTSEEFEAARKALGLSYDELADVLGVSSRAVRRWEEEGTGTARKPSPIAVRAMSWFAGGFRPPEWPTREGGV